MGMMNKLDTHGNSPFMTIDAADLVRATGGSEQATMRNDVSNQEDYTDNEAAELVQNGTLSPLNGGLLIAGNHSVRDDQRRRVENGQLPGRDA
jgi:hypothetical protein